MQQRGALFVVDWQVGLGGGVVPAGEAERAPRRNLLSGTRESNVNVIPMAVVGSAELEDIDASLGLRR